jgi:4-carboxymuconolactone decarboxylase
MARLPLITSKDQVPPEHHKIADAVIASRGGIQGPFTVLMHCPDIAAHLEALGGYVRFKGKLDMRVRVLAAMVVAREFETLYVWGAQSGSARKQNVPESTITAIREKHSRGLPAEDAQIVDFTRALLEKHRVDDALAQAVLKRFGNEQFIELTGTIGYYSLLCMTGNACELPPGSSHEVLKVS